MCSGCCIVIGHEQAAEGRFQPEHSKEVTGNILPVDPLRPDGGPNDRVPRCGDTDYHQIRAVGDYFPVPPERRVVEHIGIVRASIAVAVISRQEEEALRVGHRQGAQQHRINEAERRGRGANRQGKRENRSGAHWAARVDDLA